MTSPSRARMCPHCLLPVEYDESLLVTIDAKGNRIPLDLGAEHRPAHLREILRKAYHLCPHAGPGDEAHELPVPYLTNGDPLSIAFVGSSSVGKTHLLAAILGEVELGGLEPYGLKCLPLNPDAHRTYLRERVQSLQQGRQLGRTVQQTFARFADGLLVSARGATPRPVVFFDLAGEDLAQDGEVTRFLTGVDAFVFVLDPLRALRMPSLDPVREQDGLPRRDLGDEAFTTVLNRMERLSSGLVGAPAAIAVNKSDLVRFEPAVDRWLGRAMPPRVDREALRAESRDAYAFLAHHASRAWLKPFDDCARCTLHFVAATGGQARGDRFPHGARSRRVLAPLLSIFAMCGLLPEADPNEGRG
ncbi:ATP-binding protein [Streptomyces sp. NPDC057426]|uniref:ATP-binding protein n=1 Tax=Streptomyces sp. NPDC057426 TaxID=3346128 RepID=UPI00368FB3B3